MTRDELVDRARSLGVERAELMTRVELADEIVRRAEPDPTEQRRARGWLGVARDLVASVVESGLNLPDAAALIRGRGEFDGHGPPPVATVTLAQIYAAQGHQARAIAVLDEVLAKEPDHAAARELREQFVRATESSSSGRRTIEAQAEPVVDAQPEPAHAGSTLPETPEVVVFEATPPAAPASPPVEPVLEQASEPPAFVATSPAPEQQEFSQRNGHAEPAPSLSENVDPSHAPTFVPVPRSRTKRAACVLLSRSAGKRIEVVWDLGDFETERGISPVIRYAAWTVSTDGIVRSDGELSLSERRGRKELFEIDPAAVVRAVLGRRGGSDFVPAVIASEVAVSGDSIELRFRPPAAAGADVQPFERELVMSAGGL